MQKLLKNLLATGLISPAQMSASALFAEKRAVFRNTPGDKETAAEAKEAEKTKERAKPFGQLLDENLKNNKKFEAKYDPDVDEVAIALSKGTNPPIEAENIRLRLEEGYKELQQSQPVFKNISFREFWTKTLKAKTKSVPQRGPCEKITIEKTGNDWKFMFKDAHGEMFKFGAGKGVAIDAGVGKEIEQKTAEARERGAKAVAAKKEHQSASFTRNLNEGREAAKSNKDYPIDESILELIDNERLWLDAWQNPDTVAGMRELKQAITQAFPHLKDPDQVRKALRGAIAHGSDKYIDFEDLIEGLGENKVNPLRMPSWALRTDMLTQDQQKRVNASPSLLKDNAIIDKFEKKPRENQEEFVYTLRLAQGFAKAIGTLPNADCRLATARKDFATMIVTLNNHIYYVTIDDDAEINIFNYPSKTPYKNDEGYDNSKNYDADHVLMALDGRPSIDSEDRDVNDMEQWRTNIATWFMNAVQPAAESGTFTDGRDHILATYKELFNEDGSPKEAIKNRPDIIEWYNNVFAGSHRVMTAIGNLKYNPSAAKQVESEKATEETLKEIQRKNATPLQKFAMGITNPEATEMAGGQNFWNNYEGLAQLKDGDYEKVTRMTGMYLQTLPPGTQATLIKPFPNHQVSGRPAITLTVKVPDYQAVTVEVRHTAVGPNIVRLTNSRNESESFNYLESTFMDKDPEMRDDFLNTLNDWKMRETTWHDVMEETKILPPESKLHTSMSAEFADAALREILMERGAIDQNGTYNEQKALQVFASLATKGLSNLTSLAYKETHDDKEQDEVKANAQKEINRIEGILGENLSPLPGQVNAKAITKLTAADLQNPEKVKTLQELIRRGLIIELKDRESMKERDIEKQLAKLREEFKNDPEGRAKALETIRKAYEQNGKKPPEDLEQTFDQKIFPLMFALGFDVTTATLGLGVGTGIDLPLGDGGTIHLGAGIGAGFDLAGKNAGTVPGVGVGVGAGYSTPKWGCFSLTFGGGGGVNVLNGGLFGALGGTANFDLGGDRFNHELRVGAAVATIGGVPIVVPTALFSYKPDHEYRQEHMWEDAQKVFGLEKETPNMDDIANNSHIARMIIIRNADKIKDMPPNSTTKDVLNKIGEAKVMADYKAIREDLRLTVLQNYDPSQADSGHTFGIGYDCSSNRLIFLWAPNFVDYSSKEVTLRSSKSYESMQQETSLEQSFAILEQLKDKGKLSPEEEKKLIENGAVLRLTDGTLAVLTPNAEQPAEKPKAKKEMADVNDLETELNRIYRPLGLQVKYDAGKKMFELVIANQNGDTNYEIAMSSTLLNEGIVVEGGKLYLNSAFGQNNTFTIRRSDFRYPFPKEGKNTHTLITVSADPHETPTEIFNNSSKVLRARGTSAGALNWQTASGPDEYGTDIMRPQQRQKLNEAQFGKEKNPMDFVDNAREKALFGDESVWDKKTLETQERGAVSPEKEKQLKDFAEKIMGKDGKSGRFAVKYRKLSTNRMMLDDSNPDLLKAVQAEWKKEYKDAAPLSDIEMQKVLSHLTNLSFAPLQGKTPEQRQRALKERLEYLRPRLEKQFKLQIEKNHKNHPDEKDPFRIKSTPKALADFAINRALKVDIENPANKISVASVDRYMSLAATMGIHGMRDAGMTAEVADPLYNLHLMPEGEALKLPPPEAPQELADLVKLALDGLSPLPDIRQLDTAKLKEFKKSPLTLQVFALMQKPESGLMFGAHPEYRYTIAEIMKDDDTMMGELALNLPEAQKKLEALEAFNNILTTIRDAQLAGKKEVDSPYNENFAFTLDMDVKDGLYERCKNYTMWIKERIGARVKIPNAPQKNYAGFAAYGRSTTSAEVGGISQPSTLYKIAVGVAVKVTDEPPPPPPPPGEGTVPDVEDESGVSVGTGPDEAQPSQGGTQGGPVNAPGSETPQPGF